MKVYLVGGAVRDELLSIEVLEKDWVVVGSTEEGLIEEGYKKIGRDFPVFLHPKLKKNTHLPERKENPELAIKVLSLYSILPFLLKKTCSEEI